MHGWRLQRFSNVNPRDGFGVELVNERQEVVAEVFADDTERTCTATTFDNTVPLVVLEWFLVEARKQIASFTDGSPLPDRFQA